MNQETYADDTQQNYKHRNSGIHSYSLVIQDGNGQPPIFDDLLLMHRGFYVELATALDISSLHETQRPNPLGWRTTFPPPPFGHPASKFSKQTMHPVLWGCISAS
jgi:hypothetical protein